MISDFPVMDIPEHEERLHSKQYQEHEYVGKYDGWLAALLIASLIFGPRSSPGASLPPIRFSDFVILFLLITRWSKAVRLYGGMFFSSRIRPFSVPILVLMVNLVFATALAMVSGRYIFIIKDFFPPIVLLRMITIAAIMASLSLGERQVRQMAVGIIFLSVLVVILAFCQKFAAYSVSGYVKRFYAIQWERLEIEETGYGSRVVGTFGNANVFSGCMVILAASSLAIAINMKGLLKPLAIGTYVGLGAAILITAASRTGFISLVLVSGITAMMSFRGRARLSSGAGMFLIILLYLFVRANIDDLPLNPRMKAVFGVGPKMSEIMESRYEMWRKSARLVLESPILGVGSSKMIDQTTDNGYVMTLMRTGIVGILVYISMLIGLLVRAIRSFLVTERPYEKTILLIALMAIVNHMILEMTGDYFWVIQYGAIFAAFAGLLCGVADQRKIERSMENYQTYYAYEADFTY